MGQRHADHRERRRHAEGLAYLAAVDPRLVPVIAAAGPVPVRRTKAGYEGLARIVVSQQLSTASASAIWRRFAEAVPEISPAAVAAASDETLRGAGLSAGKIRTLRAAAAAVLDGLDVDALAALPAEEAMAALTAIKGIGPWTAEIYLLFCLGHADVLPAGDLALRNAARSALGLPEVPAVSELEAIAESWSPWRGVAAVLLWAYYRPLARREVAPA